jgi:hypothetical protein
LFVSSELEALAPAATELEDWGAELELRFGFSLDELVELNEPELP